jgi:hypothetical protein
MSTRAIGSWARRGAVVALAGWLAGVPTAAAAKDGGRSGDRREVRVTGTCSTGAASSLRLRSRDGRIALEFALRRRAHGELWRVAIVHERRVMWRVRLRAKASGAALRVRRTLRDLDGPDRVTVRASGPLGRTCETVAALRG